MTMEDAHDVRVSQNEDLAVFGVFDGHGGKEIAEILRTKLVAAVFRTLNQRLHQLPAPELGEMLRTIRNCFFQVDAQLPESLTANCGSTAVVAVVVANRYIIVANTGDSRAILLLPGGLPKTLSFDHKPLTMGERVRIENAGGYVANARVNEILALSRAFGDFSFKLPWLELLLSQHHNSYLDRNRKHVNNNLVAVPPELYQVTVEPDVMVYDLATRPPPEFLVLACDGIWDCYTNDQLLTVVRAKLGEGWSLQHIVEYVLHDCISMASNITGIGFDNMTIVIVVLHGTQTYDEWHRAMEKRTAAEREQKHGLESV